MATQPSNPPLPYPPMYPPGVVNQNYAGGYSTDFSHPPAYPTSTYGSTSQMPAGNYSSPMPQLPYPPTPYGSSAQESAGAMPAPPPPYSAVVQQNSYQGATPIFSPPCPTSPYGSNDTSGNFPMSPPYSPNESTDQETGNSEDLIDENSASAPPLSSLEKIPGYENVTFDYAILTPPTGEWSERPPDRENIQSLHQFSKEEVEAAVRHYVSEHCCYGAGAARRMEVLDIVMSSVYHYTLETFGEKRESAWCFEPYKGQAIDGPNNGRAPGPWEVVVHPEHYFKDSKTKLEIPHTSVVKPCHGCNSRGRVRCTHCMGRGKRTCNFCHGRGRRNNRSCTSCHSSGHKRCTRCHGRGRVKCKKCDGHGQLRGFLQLSVTWKNHFGDYISDTPAMPKNKIRKVTGQVVFEEKNNKVWPISHCGDHHVNAASSNLITSHSHEFPEERILQQRHSLQIVPIAICRYSWKTKTGNFCVYGFQQKVYFPDYPQKYCCGCSIL